MKSATQVQILAETFSISVHANALGKGMNPTVLLPAMGKYKGRLFSFGKGSGLEGKNLNLKFKECYLVNLWHTGLLFCYQLILQSVVGPTQIFITINKLPEYILTQPFPNR